MPLGKRQRKLLLGFGFILAAILLGLASLPVWLPWALALLAGKQGVHYLQYQRQGYARFALQGVTFTNRNFKFQAQRVEALVPTLWLWRSVVQPEAQPQAFLWVGGWQFESLPGPQPVAS